MSFWYLATPYSKYPNGIEEAFKDACFAAATLILEGVRVYCPIAQTHPIAVHGGIDPYNHEIWLPADEPFMQAARGLIVCEMPGWDISYGISEEIKAFKESGKPVYQMEFPCEKVSLRSQNGSQVPTETLHTAMQKKTLVG